MSQPAEETKEREYHPIWVRLKAREKVTLRVKPHLYQRVKKAIIKEKDMDILFKYDNGVDKRRLHFRYDPAEEKLYVYMTAKFGIDILNPED